MKKKVGNSWGVGVIYDPSGMEIPRWGGGDIIGRTIREGVWMFSGITQYKSSWFNPLTPEFFCHIASVLTYIH